MALHQIDINIQEPDAGQRIDHFLIDRFSNFSRSYIQKQIQDKRILLNGQPTRKGHLLKTGDQIHIVEMLERQERLPQPNPDLKVNVLYKDQFLAVVEKPAGMPTHPVHHEDTDTLANWWIAQDPKILKRAEEPLRPGIVHRLDTYTSGLLVLARTPDVLQALQQQFRQRKVFKEYLALCIGNPPPQGTITWPLAHDPKNKRKMIAVKSPHQESLFKTRDAFTEYRLEKEFDGFSLLRVRIRTGRMHQIRVHLSALGFPLVGDKIYAKANDRKKFPHPMSRHFLHACHLRIQHPRRSRTLEFQSPLPHELEKLLRLI